ncbi:hypothetical protein BY996DRAFT_6536678 [Phakopsora pachyrhizi]|nr:hypothetical protein BY996DRAFT_6536678 [Phakopsora pachyrhizi]
MRADPDGPPGGWRRWGRRFWEGWLGAVDGWVAGVGIAGLWVRTKGAFESNLLGPFPGIRSLFGLPIERFACVGASLADPSASEIPGSERERGGSVGTKKIRRERKEWEGRCSTTVGPKLTTSYKEKQTGRDG